MTTPPLPGDIFRKDQVLNNTWTIEGVLGRGATGEVYRARNLVTGRIVAIKALSAQFSGDEGYLELMRREEAMRDIIHEAVVRYSECSRTAEGHVFLVMDFIDGPTLSALMASRGLGTRDLLVVAHRVAEGLVAAHARGVVHRDLSPDNVILRDGQVEGATIIDFGIAKDTAAGARTVVGNQFAGKYEYAAPEQLEGKAVPASDLYALGATLAAAARGEVPFAGATPGEMIRRKAEPLDVAGLSEPLAGLILWLAAPRMRDRAPSAAAVVARLDSLLKKGGSQPPVRQPATAGARPRRAEPRGRPREGRRGWFIAAAVVLLLLAGFFLVRPLVWPALPLAEPWRLEAQAGAAPRLSGQAPDPDSAARIAAAFAAATRSEPPADALTIAGGVPFPGWAGAIEDLFAALEGLEDWTVSATGMTAAVAGRAGSEAEREAIAARLQAWAEAADMTLALDLTTAALLTTTDIGDLLAAHAACGPLSSDVPPAGVPPGGVVTVTGALPDAAARVALAEALGAAVGPWQLRVETETLDPPLCRMRRAMAGLPEAGSGIRLAEAGRAEPSLTGIYHPGDNPVADVLIPAALAAAPDAELWVSIAEGDTMLSILPQLHDQEVRLDRIGDAAGTLRAVRVLWPADAPGVGRGRIAFRVNARDFGKVGLFAFVSRGPLFPERRPGEESVAAFAEALEAQRAARPDLILAATHRLLDLRP